MKITFVSNYINHHQIPLSNRMYELLGENYRFIQTQPMEEERIRMGWGGELENVPYVLEYEQAEELCQSLILESEVVIFGGVENEDYIRERLAQKRIVLRYAERLYKEGVWKVFSPRGLIKKYKDHTQYRNDPVYLLCAGGYVSYDYSLVKAYPNKKFKFGYFPKFIEYQIEELLDQKERKRIELLWVGRFLYWKHPELAIEVTRFLKKQGYNFHMNIIGGGQGEEELLQVIEKEGLEDVITWRGYGTPAIVREYMEEANIFLFTSDFMEGWGAVLNEAMNSGCAIVASHGIGAVPFLIKHEENGLVYKNGNKKELIRSITRLMEDNKLCRRLGRNAYATIADEWNEKEVAKRLVKLCENLLNCDMIWESSGPLSKVQPIKERKMYGYLMKKRDE
ncbi:MAG: glycosyltransferase family 4 protein [Eubacteriales bacterium]